VQQVRNAIGRILLSFALTKDAAGERLTTLVKLTATWNLVAGAVTRTAIGLVVNPLTVVKAWYEVRGRVPLLYRSWRSFDLAKPNGIAGRGGVNMYAEHMVLQSDYYAYKGVFSALQSMVHEGPRTLLQGFIATALRDVPYAGMYLMFYEGTRTPLGVCSGPLCCDFWVPAFALLDLVGAEMV
jgi:solute carrier family 25 protein 38